MKNLSNSARLQAFLELACYRKSVDDFTFIDTSDPDNRKQAMKWFENELSFLGKRDKLDLLSVWNESIIDGRNSKLLFNAIKVLQNKYEEEYAEIN